MRLDKIRYSPQEKTEYLGQLHRSHQILHGEIKLATLYEETMKELLGKLDQVDANDLQEKVNQKAADMSAAVSLALAEIDGFEKDLYRHGSIATLLEVKRILLEVEE